MNARQAAQTAEDARAISLQRQEEERLANERAAAAEKIRLANEDAARKQQEAERAEAARAAALRSEEEARLREQEARNRALESERKRLQVEHEREELRARILAQLNAILETRDTPRGLVVNMSDVLFDTGKFTLRPIAREKLARITGIVLSYPELRLAAEGHTDSVGSVELNQTLSEKRAGEVMEYFVTNGVSDLNVSAAGLGENDPIADNKTAKGRQANRRVELIVSGEVIGTKLGSPVATP
jgi:outer membrane protein OmpA-like peptidoglycan-associated protein